MNIQENTVFWVPVPDYPNPSFPLLSVVEQSPTPDEIEIDMREKQIDVEFIYK